VTSDRLRCAKEKATSSKILDFTDQRIVPENIFNHHTLITERHRGRAGDRVVPFPQVCEIGVICG
jgi:hypothetical protein